MTVYVTAIRPSTARRHDEITGIRWRDSSNSTSNKMTISQTIAWLRKGNQLIVAGDSKAAEVRVVDADPPYIRTVADGLYTDSLLGPTAVLAVHPRRQKEIAFPNQRATRQHNRPSRVRSRGQSPARRLAPRPEARPIIRTAVTLNRGVAKSKTTGRSRSARVISTRTTAIRTTEGLAARTVIGKRSRRS
jgi:hypothetical protein